MHSVCVSLFDHSELFSLDAFEFAGILDHLDDLGLFAVLFPSLFLLETRLFLRLKEFNFLDTRYSLPLNSLSSISFHHYPTFAQFIKSNSIIFFGIQ